MRSTATPLVATLSMLALVLLRGSAQAASGSDVLAEELLDRIKAKDFRRAAVMFHYPANQSRAQREEDRAGVARWIETLSTELRGLQSVRVHRDVGSETILNISIAGGDVPYWASRGTIKTVAHTFKAVWGTQHDTRLTVHMMQNAHGWEVQSFHFGVLSTRPDARTFMGGLARTLMPQFR